MCGEMKFMALRDMQIHQVKGKSVKIPQFIFVNVLKYHNTKRAPHNVHTYTKIFDVLHVQNKDMYILGNMFTRRVNSSWLWLLYCPHFEKLQGPIFLKESSSSTACLVSYVLIEVSIIFVLSPWYLWMQSNDYPRLILEVVLYQTTLPLLLACFMDSSMQFSFLGTNPVYAFCIVDCHKPLGMFPLVENLSIKACLICTRMSFLTW